MVTENQIRALANVLESKHPAAGLVDRVLLEDLHEELHRVRQLQEYVATMIEQSEQANDQPAFSAEIARELLGVNK